MFRHESYGNFFILAEAEASSLNLNLESQMLGIQMQETVGARFGSGVVGNYMPVLCLHNDNLKINPHGFGIRVYILENVCSPSDRQCKRCDFGCKAGLSAFDQNNKLVKERIQEGFVYDDSQDGVKIIYANAGSRIFSCDASKKIIEITDRRAQKRPVAN